GRALVDVRVGQMKHPNLPVEAEKPPGDDESVTRVVPLARENQNLGVLARIRKMLEKHLHGTPPGVFHEKLRRNLVLALGALIEIPDLGIGTDPQGYRHGFLPWRGTCPDLWPLDDQGATTSDFISRTARSRPTRAARQTTEWPILY